MIGIGPPPATMLCDVCRAVTIKIAGHEFWGYISPEWGYYAVTQFPICDECATALGLDASPPSATLPDESYSQGETK